LEDLEFVGGFAGAGVGGTPEGDGGALADGDGVVIATDMDGGVMRARGSGGGRRHGNS
jgi:hypothetical protein